MDLFPVFSSAPPGAWFIFHLQPTACAVGCILAPLRGYGATLTLHVRRRCETHDQLLHGTPGIYQLFFISDRGKILIPLRLRGGGMPCGGQNIDSTRLVAKILRNKGFETPIASGSGNAKLEPDCFGSVRTIPLSAFRILGQGCSSQDCGIFLWMAVEK